MVTRCRRSCGSRFGSSGGVPMSKLPAGIFTNVIPVSISVRCDCAAEARKSATKIRDRCDIRADGAKPPGQVCPLSHAWFLDSGQRAPAGGTCRQQKAHAGRRVMGAGVWHDSRLTVPLMETLLQDLRYAVRTLFRTPGWTAMAVLTLAIGTGANAAVFSFVDALLFRPAPAIRPARPLISVFTSDFSSGPYGNSSYPDFKSFGADTTAFAALAAIDDSAVAPMRAAEDIQRVHVARVTGGYFDILGLRALSGRTLNESDMPDGAPPVAVISASLWDRAFHASTSTIGTSVTINGRPFTIVG